MVMSARAPHHSGWMRDVAFAAFHVRKEPLGQARVGRQLLARHARARQALTRAPTPAIVDLASWSVMRSIVAGFFEGNLR